MEYSNKKPFFNIFIVLILLTTGIYFHVINLVGFGLEKIPGDLGDGRFNNYILEHAYQFFSGNRESFWSASFMFPIKNIIAISDNLLGTAPIYSFFRFLNFDRETSYQFWFITLSILNFVISTYVFYKLTNNITIGAIGGFIFAFNIALFGQYNHLQMLPRFIIPVTFLHTLKFMKNKSIVSFIIIYSTIIFQLYCGLYLGFLLLLSVCCVFLIHIIFNFNGYWNYFKNPRWSLYILFIVILGLIPLYFLLNPYYEFSQILSATPYSEIHPTIPTLFSYFSSPSGTLIWSFLEDTYKSSSIWWDHLLFPGGFAILMLLISFIIFRKIFDFDSKYLYYSFLLLIIVTVSISNFSFYKYVYTLPGFSSIRSVSRIINIELFFFSFITVSIVNFYYKKIENYSKNLFIIIISVIIIFDHSIISQPSPNFLKKDSQERVEKLIKKINEKEPLDVFAYCPITKDEPFFQYNIDAMLAAQSINKKTVNGYSSTCIGEICPFIVNLDSISLIKWLDVNNLSNKKIKIIK